MIDGTKKDSSVLVWNSFRKCYTLHAVVSSTIIKNKKNLSTRLSLSARAPVLYRYFLRSPEQNRLLLAHDNIAHEFVLHLPTWRIPCVGNRLEVILVHMLGALPGGRMRYSLQYANLRPIRRGLCGDFAVDQGETSRMLNPSYSM